MVSISISPVTEIKGVELYEFGELIGVSGISHCVRLPGHIADRQASSAESVLIENDIKIVNIERESYPKNKDPHIGPGTGIVLWAESDTGMRIGSDNLGARGKRAEEVGKEAAEYLIGELSSGMAVDSHLCDMLVPYLAIATGISRIGITKVTSHLVTNIAIAKQILDIEMTLKGDIGEPGILSVSGMGLSSSK